MGGRTGRWFEQKSVDKTVQGKSCAGDFAWFMGEGIVFVGEVAEVGIPGLVFGEELEALAGESLPSGLLPR